MLLFRLRLLWLRRRSSCFWNSNIILLSFSFVRKCTAYTRLSLEIRESEKSNLIWENIAIVLIYSDFTSLSARHNMAATAFLACRAFVLKVFVVVITWLNYDIWYSFSVFVFGIELEAQLSHYETHCSKRFLLRKFVDRKKTRCSYTARWFEQAVKIPFSINTILVLTNASYSLQHFSSSTG